jgi:hypothetical protein
MFKKFSKFAISPHQFHPQVHAESHGFPPTGKVDRVGTYRIRINAVKKVLGHESNVTEI